VTFKIQFFKRTDAELGMEVVKNQAFCRTDDNLSLSFDLKLFKINILLILQYLLNIDIDDDKRI